MSAPLSEKRFSPGSSWRKLTWVCLGGYATHFVTFFALAGILALLIATTSQQPAPGTHHPAAFNPQLLFGASGFFFGLAFLMKQHGLFFGIFGGVYLLWKYFA